MRVDAWVVRRAFNWVGLALILTSGCGSAPTPGAADLAAEDQVQTEEELRGGNAVLGLSDGDPEAFSSSDPIFDALKSQMHVRSARMVIPFDIMDRESDPACGQWLGCPARRFNDWLDAVSTWEDGQRGVDAYVTLTLSESTSEIGMVHFKHVVEKLFRDYGGDGTTRAAVLGRTYNVNRVKYWGVANETDVAPAYTKNNPRLAARYFITAYEAARSYCRACVLVAGEFGKAPAGAFLPHGYIHEYFDEIKSHGIDPAIVSMHAYGDVNDLDTIDSRRFLKHANMTFPRARVWLSEQGTILHDAKRGSYGDRTHQVNAAWTFERLAHLRGIERAYYNEVLSPEKPNKDPYQGPDTWDSALLDWQGLPRPAYCVFTGQPQTACSGALEVSPFAFSNPVIPMFLRPAGVPASQPSQSPDHPSEGCPDPSALRTGAGGVYMYCTSYSFEGSRHDGFPIFKSNTDTLAGPYTRVGSLIPERGNGGRDAWPAWVVKSNGNPDGGFWGPDVHELPDGTFLAGYSAPCGAHRCVGIAWADHPEGPWTHAPTPFITPSNNLPPGRGTPDDSYDPSLLITQVNGSPAFYLYWVVVGEGVFGAQVQLQQGGGLQPVSPSDVRVIADKKLGQVGEGPYVIEHGGVFYEFYSSGSLLDGYYVGVRRGADPLQPFTDEDPSIVLQKDDHLVATGGNSVVQNVPGGIDFLAYHVIEVPGDGGCPRLDPVYGTPVDPSATNPHCRVQGDRQAAIDPIEWVGGWPVLLSGSGSPRR